MTKCESSDNSKAILSPIMTFDLPAKKGCWCSIVFKNLRFRPSTRKLCLFKNLRFRPSTRKLCVFKNLRFRPSTRKLCVFKNLRFRPSTRKLCLFKNLRFHSQIFRFRVDGKLKRKNKVAFSFENVLV